MTVFGLVLKRDLTLALRQGTDTLMVLAFFLIAAVLFPFALGPELNILKRIAPGVLWVTALLSAMLSFDRMFQTDYDDGTLDTLATLPAPLELTVLAKMAAHWLTTGLPLLIVAPVLGVMFNLDPKAVGPMSAAMALGTPIVSLIGGIGAALVLGARRGGVLLTLLILPLLIPVLVFGVAAVDAAILGLSMRVHLLLLAAGLLASLVLAPVAAAAALRQALHSY